MILCTINRVSLFVRVFFRKISKSNFIRELGVFILHGGIVIILLGGIVYAFFGETTKINIAPGEVINLTEVMDSARPISLKLNSFKIERNEDGTPSQYYSDVTVNELGKKREDRLISVNHPLRYENIKIYQESYGHLVRTKITAENDHVVRSSLVREGEVVEIPDSNRIVKVFRYFAEPNSSLQTNSPPMEGDSEVVYSVYENNNMLGVGATKIGKKVEIDQEKFVEFSAIEPYTVLRVKTDPGLPLVLLGSMLFILGTIVSLVPSKYVKNLISLKNKSK